MDSEENVRYVVAGNPTGWAAMAKTIRDVDEDKIKDCKEDIDTLLVFTGLFSAVLTAFVVESYQSLSPDKMDTVIQLLGQISNQTVSYTIVSDRINATVGPSSQAQPSFQPPLAALRVNQLWFSSLIITLITASFGILVKQWLREYLAVDYTSPHERLRARQFRHPGLTAWKVFEIAGVLPLLLQLALGLFLLGLCFFTWSSNTGVGKTSTVLVAGWAFLFISATIAPLASPRCPYKTALLKGVMRSLRRQIRNLLFPASVRSGLWAILRTTSLGVVTSTSPSLLIPGRYFVEEVEAVKQDTDELSILREVDAFLLDDDMLGTTIFDSLVQHYADPSTVIKFVLEALNIRLKGSELAQPLTSIPDLRRLTKRGWVAISDIVATTVLQSLGKRGSGVGRWLEDAIYLLLSNSDQSLTPSARNALVRCTQKTAISRFRNVLESSRSSSHVVIPRLHDILGLLTSQMNDLLSRYDVSGADVVSLVLQLQALETGHIASTPLHSILDVRSLPPSVWSSYSEIVGAAVIHDLKGGAENEEMASWQEDAIYILLSASEHPFSSIACSVLAALHTREEHWQRFLACVRSISSALNQHSLYVLSCLREVCRRLPTDISIGSLWVEIALSVPCNAQCTHTATDGVLRLAPILHDHLLLYPEWAQHYTNLLVDRLEIVYADTSNTRNAWPPGFLDACYALLSSRLPLSSMHPGISRVLMKVLLMDSAPALESLWSVKSSNRLWIVESAVANAITRLVAEANTEDRDSFIRAMHAHCTNYMSPSSRGSNEWIADRNIVRLCALVTQIYVETRADTSHSEAWRSFYEECASALDVFIETKFSSLDDVEKQQTVAIADECLAALGFTPDSTSEGGRDLGTGTAATGSLFTVPLLSTPILKQLVRIAPQNSQHPEQIQRLKIHNISRGDAQDPVNTVVEVENTAETPRDRGDSTSGGPGSFTEDGIEAIPVPPTRMQIPHAVVSRTT
ncbi:hypothetical protein NM688_g4812 [Phlebia brevispora]|uniref:Uncharacterized protein n=1 Tax=Phlebia brevispora TaxID=194682 RepID=A0ACC1T220_9APHY|nr:hypothetical protein NM688_g4812 [Phlebia brevispora]